MESVPGAVATESQLIARIEFARSYPVATAPGTDLILKLRIIRRDELIQRWRVLNVARPFDVLTIPTYSSAPFHNPHPLPDSAATWRSFPSLSLTPRRCSHPLEAYSVQRGRLDR